MRNQTSGSAHPRPDLPLLHSGSPPKPSWAPRLRRNPMTQPGEQKPRPEKAPSLMENWISLAGVILAGGAFFAIITLIAIDLTWGFSTPYVGILTYLVTPAFLAGGL